MAFDYHKCLISYLRVAFCAPRTSSSTLSDSCSMMFDVVLYGDVLSCRRALINVLMYGKCFVHIGTIFSIRILDRFHDLLHSNLNLRFFSNNLIITN